MNKRKLDPAALLNPVPVVLVSCGSKDGKKANAFTVAWAGTICSKPPMVSISIRPERFSYGLIRQTGEFVINLVGENLLRACDYCGVRSGEKEDKLQKMGLHVYPVEELKYAPALVESPVSLVCRVLSVQEYDGTHHVFSAQVLRVYADEQYFDRNGKLCLEKAGLVCYSHGDYYSLGDKLGFFGFSVASDAVYRKRMQIKSRKRKKKS